MQDQTVEFMKACAAKWSLPNCTKIVIEAEVGQLLKIYVKTFAQAIPDSGNPAVVLNAVADVDVTDRCEVVTTPHAG